MNRSCFRISTRALFLFVTVLISSIASGENLKVSGHGQVPVTPAKRQKDQALVNQKALADAQELARREALKQAVIAVSVDRRSIDAMLDSVTTSVVQHSATLIRDEDVKSADIRNDSAEVDLVLQVDATALRSFLEDNFNLSPTSHANGNLKIYVMSYTVEAMDPNRAQPTVLHEEVVDDQKGVHSSSYANSESNSESHSNSASVRASKSSSDKGQFSNSASASGQYHSNASGSANYSGQGEKAGVSGSASQSGHLNASASSSANWDSNHSASVDAQRHQHDSSSSSSSDSGSSYEDTSHYYKRVVDYADPTKKGAGASNEVRVELEGMLNTAGFEISTLNLSMMNRDFQGEDDLVNAVLDEMRTNASVSPEDYVAIALNSFTPVNVNTHRFTSKITYRIVRVKDGRQFMPAQDLAGDSGDRAPSDDVARTYAVKSALRKVEDILPGQIKQALRKAQTVDQREAVQAATSYSIIVENPPAFTTSAPIRTALREAGFAFERSQFRAGQAEVLTVTLNGKTGQDVMDAIEGSLGTFDVLSMDKQNAHVKAK